MLEKLRKPKIGVLFITTPRFRNLGEGTETGIYHRRKDAEAAKLLGRIDFAETVFPGVVYTREDIKAAIKSFLAAEVDMVFVWFMSWSDDFGWIRFLRDMPEIPVYFGGLNREKLGFADSLTEDRFVEFLSAGSLVGLLEASGSATRFNRPMFYRRSGPVSEIIVDLKCFAEAACMRSHLRQTNFGLLASYNEVMWSTYVDPYNLFMKAGPELRFIGVAELCDYINKISDQTAADTMEKILADYRSSGEINREKMLASVKASLALEMIARFYKTELLVLNDIDPVLFQQVGLRPGFTPCPGTKDVMVVPEGDIGGGLASFILAKLSGQPVNYVEPFYVDSEKGVFQVGHAGPNDYTDPAGKTLISTDTRFAKSGYKHAGAPFAWHVISPGEKTMLHISQSGSSFKMVATLIDSLPTEHILAGYSHGIFKPRTEINEFVTKLQNIGVTQHYAVTAGDWTNTLLHLSKILNFEFHRI